VNKIITPPAGKRGWLKIFNEFISHLRIDSKESVAEDSRGSPLTSWGSQRMFLEHVASGLDDGIREFYCLKSRQLGISTISLAIDIFWLAMHPGMQGVLVVDTDENREKFRLTIRRYIQSFPKGFFGSSFNIVKGKDNKTFTHFSNGSTLDYLVAGKRKKATLGESRAYNLAHLTEVASYGDADGLSSFRNTLAQSHPDRFYLYESTGKSFNHWHSLWIDAGQDTITKKRFFIGWWSKELNAYSPKAPQPEPRLYHEYGSAPANRDEQELIDAVEKRYGVSVTRGQLAWYRHQQSNTATSEHALQQNQPWTEEQAFILSGYSFFHVRTLQKDMSRIQGLDEGGEPVRFKGYRFWVGDDFFSTKLEQVTQLDDVEMRIWEEPSKHGTYVIGCDPAFGRNDNKDRHAISVWRCYADKLVQVAEYAEHNVETRQAAWILAYLAGTYRNCMINLELTGGPGLAILTEFRNLRNMLTAEMYGNQVKELEWEDFLSNARMYIYRKADSIGGQGYVNGWKTSRDNKHEICNQVRDLRLTNVLHINSLPLVEEMLTFVHDGSEIGGMGNNKDDRVFATALAVRSYIDWIRPGLLATNLTYERAMAKEDGTENGDPNFINHIVEDWFKRASEREEGDHRPAWMVERGLA
jgi:hypothetical protein